MQAFARFRVMDQANKLSYFQVAGMMNFSWYVNFTDSVRHSRRAFWRMGRREGRRVPGLLSSREQPIWNLAQALPRTVQIARSCCWDCKRVFTRCCQRRSSKGCRQGPSSILGWIINPTNSTDDWRLESLQPSTRTVYFPNSTNAYISNPYWFDFHPLKFDDFSALVAIPIFYSSSP